MAETNIFPLRKSVNPTTNSLSFQSIDLRNQTELPLPPHPGSFGCRRKYHTHEGVDLYCQEGDEVFAVESGEVVAIEAFTGPHAGSPWWLDTWAVLVEGETGVFCYGEIRPREDLSVGDSVSVGELLGNATMVLAQDKGRPRTMLHFELYVHGTRSTVAWEPPEIPKPSNLRDPTLFLLQVIGEDPKLYNTLSD